MRNQVLFDTHAAARKLEQAGHSARQAEAVVEVVSEATGFHMQMAQDVERIKLQVDKHMATKADIANMATKADIADMATRTDIANMATKADIADMATKTELAEFKTEVRAGFAEVRAELREIRDAQGNVREVVRDVLRSELIAIQNRWLMGVGSVTISAAGLLLALLANERLTAILLENAFPVSLTLVILGLAGLGIISRKE